MPEDIKENFPKQWHLYCDWKDGKELISSVDKRFGKGEKLFQANGSRVPVTSVVIHTPSGDLSSIPGLETGSHATTKDQFQPNK